MKKALIVSGVVILVVVAKRFGPKVERIDWQQRIEAMPDSAPPKGFFQNIKAIRVNTEQIIGLLDAQRASGSTAPASALVES